MSDTVFGTSVPHLVAFLTSKIKTPEDKKLLWAGIKREHNDELCEILGVDPAWGIQAGNLIGFDIDFDRRLMLLNYSPTAHNLLHEIPGGWTSVVRALRGLVVSYDEPGDINGVRLVSRGFEKFFNQGELPETKVDALCQVTIGEPVFCTQKEDGHMIEFFMCQKKLCSTTRGRLQTPSGQEALSLLTRAQFIKASEVARGMNFDLMTLVCEFVHPMTRVHVEYNGAKQIYLLEAYDVQGRPAFHETLVRIAQALPGVFQLPKSRWMTIDQLHAEVNDRSVVNREGWVAQIPTFGGASRRIKFKYISYIGEMVRSKLSYKYLMNCMKNQRLDKMLITLPEEIRAHAYDMVREVKVKLVVGIDSGKNWWSLYDLYTPEEGSLNNFRNVCRAYYKSQVPSV